MSDRVKREMVVKEIDTNLIEIPVTKISGLEEGPTLAVVAGVHGSEFVGIETAIRLSNNIKPEELRGDLLIVSIANLPGFLKRSMHICPVDDKNIGGLFPGDLSGSYSDKLAAEIFNIIKDSDFIIDLHGGDLEEVLTPYSSWPETFNQQVDEISEKMAEAFDMPVLLKKMKNKDKQFSKGGLYNAAAEAGIPGILAEAGSQGILDLELVERFHYRGVKNVMRFLKMIDGEIEKRFKPTYLKDFVGVYAQQRGVFYPEVKAGEILQKGARLGILKDFWGEELEKVYSPVDCCVLGVITTPSMDKGNMIAGLGELL